MQLSSYFENVVRDGKFNVLGIIDSQVKDLMFTFLDDERFIDKLLEKENITCILTNDKIADIILPKTKIGIVISNSPRIDFFNFHNKLAQTTDYNNASFKSIVENNCKISPLAHIAENNVVIGENTIIEEFASIKENTTIGKNCIVRSGAVIGSSGFEFKHTNSEILAITHIGKVLIGDNVEIKCNSVIDKAIYPWDFTLISDFTKIDNLVHIGHAVKIGKNVMIPAMSVVGGRTVINDNSWIGIGSVLRNGIIIGENARVNMGSVVTKNVNDGEAVSGNWAMPHERFIKLIKERK